MTAGFDPDALKKSIAGGGLILPADGDIQRFRPDRVVHAAVMSLLSIISGWLAGERAKMASSLEHAIEWLEEAEERGGRSVGAGWSDGADCKRALALARWLAEGKDEHALWRAAGQTAASALSARKVSQAEFAEYNLADGILDFLLAGLSAEGTELAAKVDSVPQAKWSPDARFALECCQVPGSTLPADWKDFLQERLRRWLDEGEFIRAACWLKFLLGHGGGDAESVLLAAYDFLPGIDSPSISRAP